MSETSLPENVDRALQVWRDAGFPEPSRDHGLVEGVAAALAAARAEGYQAGRTDEAADRLGLP